MDKKNNPISPNATRVVAYVDDVEEPGATWAKRLWMHLVDDGQPLIARNVSLAPVEAGDTVVGFVIPYEEGLPDELAILVTNVTPPRKR